MGGEFIPAVAVIVVTALVLWGVRNVVATNLLERARREIQPRIEAFIAENAYVAPLPEEHRKDLSDLLEMIRESRAAREAAIAEMRALKLPEADQVHSYAELRQQLEKTGIAYFKILRTIGVLKAGSLATQEIGIVWDEKHNIVGHAARHFSDVEQQFVDFLNWLGAIDLAEQGLEQVASAMEALGLDHAADQLSGMLHLSSGFLHVPGLVVAVSDAITEMKLLASEEVSWDDSFCDGIIPGLGRWSLRAAGLFFDTATGWLSCGAFTFAAAALGRAATNEVLQQRLNEQTAIVNRHLAVIRRREEAALNAVNEAVREFRQAFFDKVECCPDIDDEPAMIALVTAGRRAYQSGLADAVYQVMSNARVAVAQVPENNWIDHFLRIDRNTAMTALYWEAQREIDCRLAALVHDFSLAADRHAQDAVAFIAAHPTFMHVDTTALMNGLKRVRDHGAAGYASTLSRWELECKEMWGAGIEQVEAMTERQRQMTQAVIRREKEAMAPAARRMNSLRRRVGQPAWAA